MKLATYIVHWPGRDTPVCQEHAAQLVLLAAQMGFTVSVTPYEMEAVCLNCIYQRPRTPEKEAKE